MTVNLFSRSSLFSSLQKKRNSSHLVGEERAAEARRVHVRGRSRDGGREHEREHEEERDDLFCVGKRRLREVKERGKRSATLCATNRRTERRTMGTLHVDAVWKLPLTDASSPLLFRFCFASADALL